MKTHAVRLTPGVDLRRELEKLATDRRVQAGCIVTAVGSLSRAVIRFGGRAEGAAIEGDLEIVSLTGTLSPDGVHLHIAIADGDGRVTAGHMLEGCVVRTTAEVVIGELDDLRFRRVKDEQTGYRELKIDRRSGGE